MSIRTRRTATAVAAVFAAVWIPVAVAGAQEDPYSSPPPTVAPNILERDPAVPPSATSQGRSGGLPITGSDLVGMVVIGGGLAGAGLVLRGASRRRAPAQA